MADYRAVVRHVKYWRGAVHRWSTVYRFTGSVSSGNYPTVLQTMHDHDSGICWDVTAGGGGGIWEVALYDQAVGGVPIAIASYFDPDTPGAWVKYTKAGWTSSYAALNQPAEAALSLTWLAGLSHSGKPVRFRKWYHSVPQSPAVGAGADVLPADITSLAAYSQAKLAIVGGLGLLLGNSSRLAATVPVVNPHYENHQMPRGRRRPKASGSGSVSFPSSVLIVPGSDGSIDVSPA